MSAPQGSPQAQQEVQDVSAPFHAGELRLQDITGVRERMAQVGRNFIRDRMPDQHRAFFAQLPFVIAAGLDAQGQPWATILAGAPGFMHAPDAQHLQIRSASRPGDPLVALWQPGAPIGLLGIEPHTRRRNRMNGRLDAVDAQGMRVAVRQSFGNCPKYIHPRQVTWQAGEGGESASRVSAEGAVLSERAHAMVARADTLFIASASPDAGQPNQARSGGVDVSHRGGPMGFARLDDVKQGEHGAHTTLTIPDYVGNFMFNTLGNILLQPRAGLLFVDFQSGATLHLAGHAEVLLDSPELARFEGAQRLLKVRVTQGWLIEGALPQLAVLPGVPA